MKKYLPLIIFCFLFTAAHAQIPAGNPLRWQKTFGGTASDIAYSIAPTNDGGYIVAGGTNSSDNDVTLNHGGQDVWVVKLSNTGVKQWQYTFGGSGTDVAKSVIQTSDNGFIIAGSTNSSDGNISQSYGSLDYWVIKLSPAGSLVWQNSYGGPGDDEANDIIQTFDGGYIIAGRSQSQTGMVSGNNGIYDAWLMKISSTGSPEWNKCYGGSQIETANSIIQTSDNGFMVACTSNSNDSDVTLNRGAEDYWILKLSASGTILWQKTLGGSSSDIVSEMITTKDNNFFIVGSSSSTDGQVLGNDASMDFWGVKMDMNGNYMWGKSLGGSMAEYGTSVFQTIDSSYVLCGYTHSFDGDVNLNHGMSDAWVVKLNQLGGFIWAKSLGGSNYDYAYSIAPGTFASTVIAGSSGSNDGNVLLNYGLDDYWIADVKSLTASFQPDNDTICAKQTVHFNNFTINATNFNWKINHISFSNLASPNFTFATPGTYDITLVASNLNSIDSTTLSILVNPLPLVYLGTDTILCPGNTLTLDPGFNIDYSYYWSTGESTPTINVTTPGTFLVTATDNYTGCYNSDTIIVSGGSYIPITLGSDRTSCDGNAEFLSAGSYTGCTYQWSTGDNTESITVSATGNYSLTVTLTASGCSDADTIHVEFFPKPSVNLGPDIDTCTGNIITLDAGLYAGGSYYWSTGANTQTIQPLSNGIYWVSVTNSDGCTGRDSVYVNFNPAPSVNLGNDISICSGTSTILDAGYITGASYYWSTSENTQTISVSSQGTYHVKVSNSFGCSDADTITVNLLSTPVVDLGADLSACLGDTITLNAQNAGSLYNWSTGANSQSINVTTGGSFSVTVTDISSGCSDVDSINIILNTNPYVNLGSDIDLCSGTSATLDAGYYPGVSYFWSTSETTQTITVTNGGDYKVTVTNGSGCTDVDTIYVNLITSPVVDLGNDQTVCTGNTIVLDAQNTGSSYVWSTGVYTQTIIVSSDGTYAVTITDLTSGCTDRDSVNVSFFSAPSVNLGLDQNICDGDTAWLSAQFIAGATYSWSTGDATQSIGATMADSYSVTVTLSGGCSDADTINISVSNPATIDLGADIYTCLGDTVNIGTTCSGCSYYWMPYEQTTPYLDVYSNGTYILNITDTNGCHNADTIQVTFNLPPKIILDSIKNATCFGEANGAIFTTIMDGTAPFNYQWSDMSTDTHDHIGLAAGIYTLTVTDNFACFDTATFVISEPPAIVIDSVVLENTSCVGISDGTIEIYAHGGAGELLFSIDSGNTYQPTNIFTNLAQGLYDLAVVDQNNCVVTWIGTPVNTNSNLSVNLGIDTSICAGSSITLDAGNPGSTYIWAPGGANTQTLSVTSGTYSVTVTQGGCTAVDTIVVNENPVIVITIDSIADASCFGMNDGSIFTTVTGGTPPYNFNWMPNSGTSLNGDYTNLTAGQYILTVIDSLLCTAIDTAIVSEPFALAISPASITDPYCNMSNTGTIDITVSGGTQPYVFVWSNGQVTEDLVNLPAGNYAVTVTDANNCMATDNFILTNPPELIVTIDSVTHAVVCGSATGAIFVTAAGGNPPYTYFWNNMVMTEDNVDILPGHYNVTVTDVNGCSAQVAENVYDNYCQVYVASGNTIGSICDSINYVEVGPMVILEYADTSAGFIKSQTDVHFILRAPANFEFESGSGDLYYGNGNNDIISASMNVDAQLIDITFSTNGSYTHMDTLAITGIRVKALTNIQASQNEIKMDPSTTAAINGISLNTVFATLQQSTIMSVTNISTFHVDNTDMVRGSLANCVAGIKITTTGNCGMPMVVQEFELTTAASENTYDNIGEAKIFYTGHSPYFGAVDIQGSVINPDGTFSIVAATPVNLLEGENYFWLAYDVKDSAIVGDSLEGQCIKAIIDGNYYYANPMPPISLKRMVNSPGSFVSHHSGNWDEAWSWGGPKNEKLAWAPDINDDVTINNGDTITLTSNASCRHLTINDGLLLPSSYQLTITGNLTGNEKDSIRSTSSSSLVINDFGSADTFRIPAAMKKLKVLTLNRATGATCNHDLDLDDAVPSDSIVLILSNGALKLSAGKKLFMNSKAIKKDISCSNSTYVDGIVSRNIKRDYGFYIYPLGDAGECRPFGIRTQNGNGDNISEVQFFWTIPINYQYIDYHFLPGGISNKMYWHHDIITGANTARRIFYHDDDFPGLSSTERIAALCLANNDGVPASEWTKETTPYAVNDATKYVEFSSANASNDEYWTFGSVVESSPLNIEDLPIELLSFYATLNEELSVDLEWTTVTETNNDFFTIERAGTDLAFTPLTTVNGAGNSFSLVAYHTVDENPLTGTSYYRLKQTDFDGEYTYSEIRTIVYDTDNPVLVYPNPARSEFYVQFFAQESDEVTLTLFDDKGQKVYETETSISKGTNEVKIDTENLRHGVYTLRIDFEKNTIKPYRKKVSLISE